MTDDTNDKEAPGQNEVEEKATKEGTVIEALPNTMFRIAYEDGEEGVAYLAGKMRLHRIRVMVGDSVTVEMDPYGGKGRIVRRH